MISSNSFSETEDSLTASDLLEYLFCPRFIYFERYLHIPQHEEKRYKVEKGREIHEERKKINPQYLRKKIGCVDRKFSVYLSSPDGWKGVVDEVLELEDGAMAPLDYKFAEYDGKTFFNHKAQLVYYASLIRHTFQKPVKKGFIIYTRSNNKLVEIPIEESDFIKLKKITDEIKEIIQKGKYPLSTVYRQACFDCCYRNICERRI
ncbi:MAG TPA: CRISPR-associated protein Cas4 [Candidatus Atribacteria bacterium]|nr:CRISPR-associated protein Cas4 [Candidatus Atribacteria bacterium]